MGRLWATIGLTLALGLSAPAAQARPYSFLTAPTDQLAVPGWQEGTDLTPDGSLYTGWAELRFRFGPRLRVINVVARRLLLDRFPVLTYELRSASVSYTVTTLCAPVGGRPVNFVRVVMRNASRREASAAWGAGLRYSGGAPLPGGGHAFRFPRPGELGIVQPGVRFDPGSVWRFSGDAVARDGQVLLLFPRAPAGFTRRLTLRPGHAGQVVESTVFGESDYRGRLAPGATRELDFAMPVIPVSRNAPAVRTIRRARFGQRLQAVLAYWRRLFSRAVQIGLPDAKVTDTFYASLANMALARYPDPSAGWVQTPNKLQYNTFFLRDATVIARALDLAGLHDLAGQDIDYFTSWQQPGGLFISQPGQLDGHGEALWAIGQHAQWPGERAFAVRMLPHVQRAIEWLRGAVAQDPLGLLPASTPGDNELTSGHITGDDFWAADGLSAAISLAQLAGRPDLAQQWSADLASFLSSLRGALAKAQGLTGGWIPPALEANGGQDWGNLWAAYPAQVALPAASPAVTATIGHVSSKFREGIATYLNGSLLHDYLGFRVFETELERGEQAPVVAGLYAELAHSTATGGGFELGIPRGGPRALDSDLAPHGWFAAEYVALLRNMLVREDGASLVLLGAVSPRWLEPGAVITVRNARTARGAINFTLRAVRGGAVLSWHGSLMAGTTMRWQLPAAAHHVVARGLSTQGTTIALRGRSGTVSVRWRLSGPFPSFAATVRRVLSQYARSSSGASR